MMGVWSDMSSSTELFASLLKSKYVTDDTVRHKVRVEFDGGTPCNIPRLGYGEGYGSYQICAGGHTSPIVRRNFGRPMSANVAEISTLIAALKTVVKSYNPKTVILEIHGDSKIALSRCKAQLKPNKSYDPSFAAAVTELQSFVSQFGEVTTFWRGRIASVRLFGH